MWTVEAEIWLVWVDTYSGREKEGAALVWYIDFSILTVKRRRKIGLVMIRG